MTASADPVLIARCGRFWRVAPSPGARMRGGHHWDAGPAAEFCELPREMSPDAISGLVARACVSFTPRAGKAPRRARQQAFHELLGICTRPAPHWGA